MPASTITKRLPWPCLTYEHARQQHAGRAPPASGPARAAAVSGRPASAGSTAAASRAGVGRAAARRSSTPSPPPMSIVRSAKPSASSCRLSAASARAAAASGSRSVICEPMWHCTPTTSMPGSAARPAQDRGRRGDVDAELVLAQAGRDVGVRAGVDVRVDAQRDARRACRAPRPPRAMRAISSSLSALNSPMPCSSPSAISASVLPTPGEDDPLRREAGAQRRQQLAARDDVGARAERRPGAAAARRCRWP